MEESKAAQVELQERLSKEEEKSLKAEQKSQEVESKLQETNSVTQRLETQKIEVR